MRVVGVAVLVAAACAGQSTLVRAEPEAGIDLVPAENPIITTPSSRSATQSLEEARRRADAAIGGQGQLGKAIGQLVEWRFEQSLVAEFRSGLAWLFSYEDVLLTSRRGERTIRVNVAVDATTGDLLAVYTECKLEWVAPSQGRTRGEPLHIAATDDWEVAPLGDRPLQRDALQVMEHAWEQLNLDPESAGIMIVAPAYAAIAYDQKLLEGGVVPAGRAAPAWVITVLGTVAWPPTDSRELKTGLVGLIDDERLELRRGGYLW